MEFIKLITDDHAYHAKGSIHQADFRYTNSRGVDVYTLVCNCSDECPVWVVEDESNPTNENIAGVIVSDYVKSLVTGTSIDNSYKEDNVNMVEHPNHYNAVKGMPEVWDVLDALYPDEPDLWNVGKYYFRAPHKGTKRQDIEKLVQYAQRWLDKEENG